MIKSLCEMNNVKNVKKELWLKYLYDTCEKNYNILNVNSLSEINKHSVFNYVLRTLQILDRLKLELNLDNEVVYYVEETLKWSEISKTGNKKVRKCWKKNKYDLFCHNIASSQIYLENNNDEIVYTLIKTHGLVGQYIKGEVNLNKNIELYYLINDNKISKDKLKTILLILNQCIIEGVSSKLYTDIKDKVENTIDKIVNGEFNDNISVLNRLKLLNKKLSNDDEKYINSLSFEITNNISNVFSKLELWFFDSALYDFKIENLLAKELNIPVTEVTKSGKGSFVNISETKGE